MFALSIICIVIALIGAAIAWFLPQPVKGYSKVTALVMTACAAISFAASMFTTVAASNVGVVTTFGKVGDEVLKEGAHFVLPWDKVTEVYLGQQQVQSGNSEAGSRDLQSVHATLSVNFTVDPAKARDLYIQNPALNYGELIVLPAIYEIFKAVVAKYTAEELITKRQEVSDAVARGISTRLAQYHLRIQNVNLVNFGFSKSFDQAVEQKVTASQNAETAKRNLEKVKYEADARIAQAEGEAKAIAIQAAATEKSGGAAYIQLQAIEKWDGKLPQYMTAGTPTPFIGVK